VLGIIRLEGFSAPGLIGKDRQLFHLLTGFSLFTFLCLFFLLCLPEWLKENVSFKVLCLCCDHLGPMLEGARLFLLFLWRAFQALSLFHTNRPLGKTKKTPHLSGDKGCFSLLSVAAKKPAKTKRPLFRAVYNGRKTAWPTGAATLHHLWGTAGPLDFLSATRPPPHPLPTKFLG